MHNNIHNSSVINYLADYRDHLREGLLKYTRKAFRLLPSIKNPNILDIGCGSGVPSIELARLSHGKITAVDIDQRQLDRLRAKVKQDKLENSISVVECSMTEMHLESDSFDIIWAEGSIDVIGFEIGIREWKRFLKPGGFLVVHDDRGNIGEKITAILQNQYVLFNWFEINEDIWWKEYYSPLNKKLIEIRQKYQNNPEIDEILNKDQIEIEGYYRKPLKYRSVFLIMKRI